MSDTATWQCLKCKTEFIESGGDPNDWTLRRVHCLICKTVARQERVS